MKVIWKYPFEVNSHISLQMPKGAKVLSVQVQKEQPCLWALVNADNEKETRTFACYGTGHLHDEINGNFIGTFQLINGSFIGHLFEEVIK